MATEKRYDPKCRELAEYFFGEKDPRLDEIAQALQDKIEDFPNLHPDCECEEPEHRLQCKHHAEYDPTPYCSQCGPKSACTCPPHPEND